MWRHYAEGRSEMRCEHRVCMHGTKMISLRHYASRNRQAHGLKNHEDKLKTVRPSGLVPEMVQSAEKQKLTL